MHTATSSESSTTGATATATSATRARDNRPAAAAAAAAAADSRATLAARGTRAVRPDAVTQRRVREAVSCRPDGARLTIASSPTIIAAPDLATVPSATAAALRFSVPAALTHIGASAALEARLSTAASAAGANRSTAIAATLSVLAGSAWVSLGAVGTDAPVSSGHCASHNV